MQDSGDNQGEDEGWSQRDSDAESASRPCGEEVAAFRQFLPMRIGSTMTRMSESIEKRLENQGVRRELEALMEEVERNEKRGEETHRIEVFVGGEGRHAFGEKAGHQAGDEGPNQYVDADGLSHNGADDADHEQEREFGAGSEGNDIFPQSEESEGSQDDQQSENGTGDGEGSHRVGVRDEKQDQQRGDFPGDGADGHFSLLVGREARVGEGIQDESRGGSEEAEAEQCGRGQGRCR